jgi:hypothetical protein
MSAAVLPLYERPSILRHQVGHMNKFGRAPSARPVTHLDNVPVDDLVAKYGSPLFVFSQKTLVQRYRELHQAFAGAIRACASRGRTRPTIWKPSVVSFIAKARGLK